MPTRVILEVLSGPISGKRFVFDSHDTFLFGRHTDCHAQLPKDGFVSRHHFLLEANPPDARIRDLGSLNGTIVNQRKIGGRGSDEARSKGRRQAEQVDLKDGDQIVVGNTRMHVQIELPLRCGQCGCEIEDEPSTQADPLCAQCASRQGSKATVEPTLVESEPVGRPAKTLPEPVFGDSSVQEDAAEVKCARCGKSLSDREEAIVAIKEGLLCTACNKRMTEQTEKEGQLQVPGFVVERTLGKGGMGIVYMAHRSDKPTERVAIKRLLAQASGNEGMRRQFLREMKVNMGLAHERIVRMHESGSVGQEFYFVMEYCRGGSLVDQMRRAGGKLDLSSSVKILQQSLEGLEYAHKEGFVHRDLKPQNVLIGQDERGGASVKIADFGLAKSFQLAGLSGMTATGTFGGTWHFMPREQLTNFKYVEPASDVWSIAATFYYVVSGAYPREFPEDRDAIEVILHESPVPIRKRSRAIPVRTAAVIDRALSDDLERRYVDAAEFRQELKEATSQG